MVKQNYPLLIIILIWIVFSLPVFSGKVPFPSDYQVNSFQPWSVYPGMKGPVKNNAQPDIITQIYPWRYYAIEEFKQGRIPFWNPYSFAGTPHLANYQSAALFPLNILFFLPTDFINVWSFLVVLQPLFAGIFMYFLARALNISNIGSTISAISFMFCGFLTTWLGYSTLGYAILPLPFALYCILKFQDNKKIIWPIFLSLTFPFSFFSGHFQTSIYFALGVFLFIIYSLATQKKKNVFIYLLVFVVAGILLTMPQVLPSLEFYLSSIRSELFQKVEAIPIQYLVTLFSPDFFGNPVTRNDWFGHYAEWNGFSGIVVFSLALFAILNLRSKQTLFFIFLSIVALLLALDTPLLSFLVSLKIPVISTSSVSRIIVLFSFSIAVLAGFGFDSIVKNKSKKKILIWVVVLLVGFSTFSMIGLLETFDSQQTNIAIRNSILPSLILLMVTLSGLIMLVKKKKLVKFVSIFLVVLVALEMYRFSAKWQNFDSKEKVFKQTPVVKFLTSKIQDYRTIGFGSADVSVYYKLPILAGYDPLYISDYGEFVKFVDKGKIDQIERSGVSFPLRGKYSREAIDFLGVKYIAHKHSDNGKAWSFPFMSYPQGLLESVYDDGKYEIFENKNTPKRAFTVSNIKTVTSKKEALDFIFSNNPRAIATIEEAVEPFDKSATANVEIMEYKQNIVSIDAESTGKTLLVLADAYYPGWRAYINGKETKIFKVNTAFRGVFIPKGESIVEFKYFPLSFLYGIYLSFVGVLIMTSTIILKVINKRK